MTIAELVQTMEGFIFTDDDGNVFYPEVYRFIPYIKVAESDIDNEIPEGLPKRLHGEENDIIHTWRTWRDATHPLHSPIEGYYYFMSATFGGEGLLGSELMLIYNASDVTLVDERPAIIE